jgi:uncharacterized protein with von Willebrand factor type A (vWA) domain
MPINLTLQQSEAIRKEMYLSYSDLLDNSKAAQIYIDDQLMKWQLETKIALSAEFPFSSQQQIFLDWERRLQTDHASRSEFNNAVDDFIDFCSDIGHPGNTSFWKGLLKQNTGAMVLEDNSPDENIIGIRLLIHEWKKRIDQAYAEWEFHEIERRRNALMTLLESALNLLRLLEDKLQELGVGSGVLFDLSKGKISEQDIQRFMHWAKYLAEDKGVKALCEMLGRIRQIELSEKIEHVNSVREIKTFIPDINSREEIIGVRLGRDLEYLFPAELTLLADPETALLFDLKYVEAGLMCFDMRGMQDIHRHEAVEVDQSVKDQEKQGPMIICIDTSGSMSGMPETIAKAVALFLAAKTREQKRPCYLINFSNGIDTLDLGADIDMEVLLRFLAMSFHGGTDAAPALHHALDIIETDIYKNSDLLIISDFVMSGLPEDIFSRIDAQRLNGNKFYSLVVGNTYMSHRLKTLFDNEWIFVPGCSQIHELVQFERNVNQRGQELL